MVVSLFIFSFRMFQSKHFKYLLFLILFTITMDVAIGNLYEALYLSEKSRNSDRLIHSVLETNEDILIFGSSRASHHYIPKIIEDSLSMSCFNVGFDGKIFFSICYY